MSILEPSFTNQNLVSLSIDTFRIYGRAIADMLDDSSNDLTDEQKNYWTNQLIEITSVLENYVKIAGVIIESREKEFEKIKNLALFRNAMLN